jgi:hypothetical protein
MASHVRTNLEHFRSRYLFDGDDVVAADESIAGSHEPQARIVPIDSRDVVAHLLDDPVPDLDGHWSDRPVARVDEFADASGTDEAFGSRNQPTGQEPVRYDGKPAECNPLAEQRGLHHNGIVREAQRLGGTGSARESTRILRHPVFGRVGQFDDRAPFGWLFRCIHIPVARAADRQHDFLHH